MSFKQILQVSTRMDSTIPVPPGPLLLLLPPSGRDEDRKEGDNEQKISGWESASHLLTRKVKVLSNHKLRGALAQAKRKGRGERLWGEASPRLRGGRV